MNSATQLACQIRVAHPKVKFLKIKGLFEVEGGMIDLSPNLGNHDSVTQGRM